MIETFRYQRLDDALVRIQFNPDGDFERTADPSLTDELLARIDSGEMHCEHDTDAVPGSVPWSTWDIDDAGRVTIAASLADGERIFGAYDADATGVDRRGDLIHLTTELHPVGGHSLDPLEPSQWNTDRSSDIMQRRDDEAQVVGGERLESNYGELVIPFFWSTAGYAIYISNQTSHGVLDFDVRDDGHWTFTAPGGFADVYVMQAASLDEALRAYARLTGHAQRPPHWALGYIQSRFGYESFDHARSVVDRMRDLGIPMHALVYDVQWLAEYVTLKWDLENFPDPKQHLQGFADDGIRSIVISEPGTRADTDNFAEGAAKGYFALRDDSDETYPSDPWYCGRGIDHFKPFGPSPGGTVNFFNDAAGAWWYDQHRHLRDEGIDAWWLDLNEPEGVGTEFRMVDSTWPFQDEMTGMQVRNVLALAQQRQFAMHDEADGHRPFVLSRAGAAGSQRFGASPWTGDIGSTWIDMARQPRLLMNAGLSGIPFAGCDVGGFFGDPEPELFARWMQSAALMPVMRAHASLSDREPWSAGDEALPHVAAAIRLRSRLLPSLVSWAYASVRDGLPVMRAMALAFPDDADLAGVDDQWMAGPILCAPVLERQQRTRTVRLPSGSWQRIRHDADGRLSAVGDVVDGPVSVDVDVELHDLPMFMQAGSVVLVDPAPMDRRSYAWPPPQLEAFAVADASGTATGHFTFDEGTGLAWRDGAEVTASVEVDQGTLQTVVVDGDAGLMPEVVASA